MERLIFVDHLKSSFLNSGSEDISYHQDLFAIYKPFAAQSSDNISKRKRAACGDSETELSGEWPLDQDIADNLKKFVIENSDEFAREVLDDAENSKAKQSAAVIPSSYFFRGCTYQIFFNENGKTQKCYFQNRQFLLPPHSVGILSTLSPSSTIDMLKAAHTLYGSDGRFDLIVMDPPWINKSVKRQRRYMTADAQDCLSQLKIQDLLAYDGLLIVWYTHNISHYTYLKEQLSGWNLQLVATWTWLKVTTNGTPICPLGRNFKKPYEHVLLATRNQLYTEKLFKSNGKIIVSVPSAIHSHKPNLECVLEQFDIHCKRLRCLELFARTLKSNWVCFGNEVIKLQCVEVFDVLN
ncbi:methyltransferase-like protein 4 [Varroa jacobsoni]|uniref:Methyltransferase-like protein 4 n=1 Tax=Varroa destructor TaxID=109461 RepID=A0A7M7KWB2_VARDE|nr:methyltransferase-like protein 4 [Varroa destructor]XP_022672991.1 methyltransferase-like protein 4 [Varroa destructor]XP_022672993.1 methyltransferase-like protein 4 [Varroa destructor]XP_022710549.1 methyltransferase-like protein 4 [Varroa jacobsoni]